MINLQNTGRNQCPCKNCPDHRQPCSDHCQKPEYLAWKDENEKINKRDAGNILAQSGAARSLTAGG